MQRGFLVTSVSSILRLSMTLWRHQGDDCRFSHSYLYIQSVSLASTGSTSSVQRHLLATRATAMHVSSNASRKTVEKKLECPSEGVLLVRATAYQIREPPSSEDESKQDQYRQRNK